MFVYYSLFQHTAFHTYISAAMLVLYSTEQSQSNTICWPRLTEVNSEFHSKTTYRSGADTEGATGSRYSHADVTTGAVTSRSQLAGNGEIKNLIWALLRSTSA